MDRKRQREMRIMKKEEWRQDAKGAVKDQPATSLKSPTLSLHVALHSLTCLLKIAATVLNAGLHSGLKKNTVPRPSAAPCLHKR